MEKDDYEELCEAIYGECQRNPALSRKLPADAIWMIADKLLKYSARMIVEGLPKRGSSEMARYREGVRGWYDKYYPKAARRKNRMEAKR